MFYPSCLHTHSQFCDGKATMAQMAEKAADFGFVSLGFSSHSPLPYENDWAMREEAYPAYFDEIARLKELYKNKMEIYCGIEWDTDTPRLPFLCSESSEQKHPPFDYVIGAVHSLVKNGELFSVDYTKDLLLDVVHRLYGGDFWELCRDYYSAVVQSALRPEVDIVAHFDLITKYNRGSNLFDERDSAYLDIAKEALERILEKRPHLFFEINTGVMARAGNKNPYPAPALLHILCENRVPLILTGDCHRPEHFGVGYDFARELLLKERAPRLYLLSGGKFRKVAL